MRAQSNRGAARARIAGVLVERIARFVADPKADTFDELALAAFAFQFEAILPYRRMCERRGATPGRVADWRQVPMVPARAFKSLALHAAPPLETFRSSGTTQGERSVHHHPFPDLYRRTIDASFPGHCLPGPPPVAMLSLVPSRAQLPDSSLAFMIDHVLRRWGDTDSVVAFAPRGVEVAKARSWLGARQRAHRPGLVLATAFALADLLAALERQDLRFRLPAGSAVFETGGFKGRSRELSAAELTGRIADRLGVPAGRVVREYGMTELTSQFYSRALSGGDPERFAAPAWTRVRILDPQTLAEAPAGAPGLIAIFDLANLGSAAPLLTEDLGVADGDGFRLLGRAPGAELRGCSLTVEEMA
jgi:hypothetical protein